jgi:hypothetical protein
MTDNSEREDNDEPYSQFSVFEGDLVNRGFAKLGLGSRHPLDLLGRVLVLIGVTWLPMAVLALFTPPPDEPSVAQNFFYDFAAYTQFFFGIPLFIVAERLIAKNMRSAAQDFANSGVVAAADQRELAAVEAEVAVKRRRVRPDVVCMIIGFVLSLCTIGPELFWHSENMRTWHVVRTTTSRDLTPAGWWLIFIALPIQIYWWVRWIWKIGLWYGYLNRVSKFRLVLIASHPDRTGGIGFLSEVQAKFAIVILAFGISNVVSTIGYKIAIEQAPIDLPAIWGAVVAFVIGAPLFFLAPLLLFTKQLGRTKKRALAQFREKAMQCALRVERQWLDTSRSEADRESDARSELSQLNLLNGFYERIHGMRVVPFDLRSAAQLFGSAVGPVIPLLPYFFQLPEPWQKILEALTKWLPH